MAIVSMQKIRLLTYTSITSDVFEYLQKVGLLELREVSLHKLNKNENSVFEFNYVNSRLDFAVNFLTQYVKTKGKMKLLLEGDKINVKDSDFIEMMNTYSFNDAIEESVDMQEELKVTVQKLSSLSEERILLKRWSEFPVSLGSIDTKSTQTLFIEYSGDEKRENIKGCLEGALIKRKVIFYTFYIDSNRFALVVLKSDYNSVLKEIKNCNLNTIELPKRRGSTSEEIERIGRAINKTEERKTTIEQKVRDFAYINLEKLKIMSDYISWKKEKHNVISGAYCLGKVLVFEGWCPQDKVSKIRSDIYKLTNLIDLEEIESEKDEEIPVEIKNNKIITPFESVTRLYGLPGYRDLDPTIFLAGFFFIFFGLSLTDVGYGAFLAIVTGASLYFFKIPEGARLLVRLLMIGGIASILIGILFGGYLGIDPSLLPHWTQTLQKFDPIANPLPVFYLSLGLGVIQVMFGIFLRIVSEAKNGNLISGILDHGPWLFLFVAFILLGASKVGFFDYNTTPILYLAFLALILSGARHGKTILQKISKGLLSLYDIIGYFSDILSYSRLLALGLATSALAFAVNLIAGLIGHMIPVVGPIIAVGILIIGHLFNLAVNTLGAFIHGARLQFVEFFGKFITGAGRSFHPFKRNERYVTVIE